MSTMGVIASVVALSLVVHVGLFLWIRGRIRGGNSAETDDQEGD